MTLVRRSQALWLKIIKTKRKLFKWTLSLRLGECYCKIPCRRWCVCLWSLPSTPPSLFWGEIHVYVYLPMHIHKEGAEWPQHSSLFANSKRKKKLITWIIPDTSWYIKERLAPHLYQPISQNPHRQVFCQKSGNTVQIATELLYSLPILPAKAMVQLCTLPL